MQNVFNPVPINLRFDAILKDLDLPAFGQHDALNDALMTVSTQGRTLPDQRTNHSWNFFIDFMARNSFAKGESIHTECSYKYTVEEFHHLAAPIFNQNKYG